MRDVSGNKFFINFFSFILYTKGHDKNADEWLDGRDVQCKAFRGGCEYCVLSRLAIIRIATFSTEHSSK